ncbi:MAG: alpha/beta hydrolase [Planctomycetota bacterium]|jgi:acetyl esterase/lipase
MTLHRINHNNASMNMSQLLLAVFVVMLSLGKALQAVDLPKELPLWEKPPLGYAIREDVKEQVRSYQAQSGSPSGLNRVFSSVSLPTYSIHRPRKPNGVGLVICPGGGFRDVWIDREGHDFAIWLKDHNVTSLVLKYRTRVSDGNDWTPPWKEYQRAVQADGRQAIRILRKRASELGLQPDKIGICGFSAGGHLALNCLLNTEPKPAKTEVSSMPNFAGLFYPGIPDDVSEIMVRRADSKNDAPDICPIFMINARVDRLTPADKCVHFYSMLLKAGVKAELHVFSKGSHGFGLGVGRGKSTSMWTSSFIAWLSDCNIIQQ